MKPLRALPLLAPLVLTAGCGLVKLPPLEPAGSPEGAAACSVLGPLTDLRAAVGGEADAGGSALVFYLADTEEELADAHVALDRLKGVPGADLQALGSNVEHLATMLEAREKKLEGALAAGAASFDAAVAAREAVTVCKGVDMRDFSRARDRDQGKGGAAAPSAATGKGQDDESVRKANTAIVASKACESAVRLWATAKGADLTSDISSESVASQMAELNLDKERAALRDALARALKRHVEALRAIQATAAPRPEARDEEQKALFALTADVATELQAADRVCLESMRASDRVVGGRPEPRRATVNVRPQWPGALQRLAGRGGDRFGSGFVVRWRTASGAVETRIITNNHVMSSALEAEILSGAADPAQTGPDGKNKGLRLATLIHADPHEDVAILRLDPVTTGGPAVPPAADATAGFQEGLTFRLAPAREGEPIEAAGFPAVGVRPSFQVSPGTVSNAKLGPEGQEASVSTSYVQHTAPIDPGSSGGPLLDGDGRLLGMNTLKLVGRENVGLAIPTARIQAAMLRADQPSTLTVEHARAACNAVVGTLSTPAPVVSEMRRFGLRLFEASENERTVTKAGTYRDEVRGATDNPVEEARLYAYGAVRARVEQEGGVGPFAMCSAVGPRAGGKGFEARFRTVAREHVMVLDEEGGVIRMMELL